MRKGGAATEGLRWGMVPLKRLEGDGAVNF